jgi:hypothetical protein
MTVTALGTDLAAYTQFWVEGRWTGWHRRGGTISGAPAVWHRAEEIDLVAHGFDRDYWLNERGSTWTSIGRP